MMDEIYKEPKYLKIVVKVSFHFNLIRKIINIILQS